LQADNNDVIVAFGSLTHLGDIVQIVTHSQLED